MSVGRKRLITMLVRAQGDQGLVGLQRRKHLDTQEGYVLGVGEQWLLLANLDGAIVLDGYIALRISDVKSIKPKGNAGFVRAALTLRGQWPPAPPPARVALDSTRDLLSSLRGRWPLVTVHPELDDPNVCFIGEVHALDRKTMRLRGITPRATWDDATSKFRLGRITRIDVGGSYEQALSQVAARNHDPAQEQ